MGKTAFIFSGQGAQYVGMGKDVAEAYPEADAIYEKASAALDFDIKKMIFNGDEETLKITENTQPAIVATSIALMQPLLSAGIRPDVTAGLSLGEYSAHVAAGSLSFFHAVALVRKRGKFMQEEVPVGKGTMAAILGLSDDVVAECCQQASAEGVVQPANYNCPGQVVIAGEVKAVEKAVALLTEKGAKRAMMLNVSAPFHCSLLQGAGEKLMKEMEDMDINPMEVPVVANVTGHYIQNISDIKPLLKAQVSSPVKWTQCVQTMIADGVDTFVEIGPGKVLTGFIKKIDKNVKTFNVENVESLKSTLEALLS